ncbi:helix-turn-helix domain-containing protein [Deinococcus apachensis]|uniref:helix-turn-helix domain-containing protein n=1 Tax=Deinococcus apachensis TaxID=309886 RepID=UPI000A07A830|nr:helix-turn-helix transcriptional regulator [Deinococcus apachensis]
MIEWQLKHLLEQEGITPYRLSQLLDGQVSRNTIYALARGKSERVDLSVLNAVISQLRRMTGRQIDVSDLLYYKE